MHHVAEASELRLAPGVWPPTLNFDGFVFTRVRVTRVEGEVVSVTYAGAKGMELEVLND